MEDLVTGLFGPTASFSRLGRSPSEAEFAQFLSLGALPDGGAEGGNMGLHRVASIDMLRRLIMNQQAAMAAEGGVVVDAGARAAVAEQLAQAAGLRPQMSTGIAGARRRALLSSASRSSGHLSGLDCTVSLTIRKVGAVLRFAAARWLPGCPRRLLG